MSPVGTLLRHQWARHRTVLGVMAVALAAFELIITRVAPAPNEQSWMSNIMAMVPPRLLALAGDQLAATASGMLAIGYGHPFFIVVVSAWTVRASSGALAGEIGLGTMDLVASRPVARWQVVVAGFLAVILGLVALLAAAWGGTALGLAIRPLDVSPVLLLKPAAGAALLFAAWGGVGLALSATRRDAGQAIAWSTAIIAVSFVLDYVARLWDPVKGLRPLSLFRYYEAHPLVATGFEPRNIIVLAGVALTSLILAILAFRRRDL